MSLSGPPAAKVEQAPPPAVSPDGGAPPAASKWRLPTVQRADEPVEAAGAPAVPVPAPGAKLELKYEPGLRYILSGHRENYFISGVTSGQHTVKFQYSVKFDLWPNATRHSVYFGFTQKSLWALWDFAGSSPFLESNYAPEIFYGYYPKLGDIMPQPGRRTWFLDQARAGIEHESNGMNLTSSRSWNRVTATGRGGVYLGTDHYLTGTLKVWAPPFEIPDNSDITEYVGYGTGAVEYGYDPAVRRWYGGGSLNVAFNKGAGITDWDRRTIQVTLQWRPAYAGKFVEWWKFTPYFFAQYFNGYGETLLTYNIDTQSFRIGLSFEDRVNWVTVPKQATAESR